MFKKILSLFGVHSKTENAEIQKLEPNYVEDDLDKELRETREEYEALRRENDEWLQLGYEMREIADKGREAENDKRYEDAVAHYIAAIRFAEEHPQIDRIHNYSSYFDRLAILFRKLKRYQDEINVLEKHESLCIRDNAYWIKRVRERLEKARALNDKQKTKKQTK